MVAIKIRVQPEVMQPSKVYGNYHENTKEMNLVMTVLSKVRCQWKGFRSGFLALSFGKKKEKAPPSLLSPDLPLLQYQGPCIVFLWTIKTNENENNQINYRTFWS